MITDKQFSKRVAAALSVCLLLAAVLYVCTQRGDSSAVKRLNPKDYPDTSVEQWREVLPIYVEWNGFEESCDRKLDRDGIIGESSPPPTPQTEQTEDGETVILPEHDLPGGRTFWFRGLSPGDAVITFTTRKHSGEAVYIRQYAVRVYADLRLDILHSEVTDLRDR